MKKFFVYCLLIVSALVFSGPVRAEDLGAVKSRMADRLAQVEGLKAGGAVGENNRGFLEARSGEAGAVVSAENKDRETVYAALAKQTGTSPEQVGRLRARQIAQHARPGEWIQDERGQWRKK